MKPIYKAIIVFLIVAIILIIVLWSKKTIGKNTAKNKPGTDPKTNGGGSGSGTSTVNLKYNEGNINALPDGTYPLVKGQKSKLVFLLQYALNRLNNDTLALDGDFGSQTAASVDMQFGASFVNKDQADLLLQSVILLPDIDPYVVYLFQNL